MESEWTVADEMYGIAAGFQEAADEIYRLVEDAKADAHNFYRWEILLESLEWNREKLEKVYDDLPDGTEEAVAEVAHV